MPRGRGTVEDGGGILSPLTAIKKRADDIRPFSDCGTENPIKAKRREFMFQIKNLSMNHTKDSHVLSENLSFVLNDGDKAAIIGEEGNGKSTLLKLIYDPELVENYIEYSGEIIRNGSVFGYLAQEISDSEKELSGRTHHNRRSQQCQRPRKQTYQSSFVRRGRQIPGQCRNRG